jgi:Putative lumazine-binding
MIMSQQPKIHEGVQVALEHYFTGHATGDASHMRLAFLPTAHIEGFRESQFLSCYPAASGRGIQWNLANFAKGSFAWILIFSRQSLGEFDPQRLK